MPWPAIVVAILVSAASAAISYSLMKAPKDVADDSRKDLPVAQDGKPIPVIFGTVKIKDINILWFGDISVHEIIDNGGK